MAEPTVEIHLLVIDDDALQARSVRRALEPHRILCECATNGDDAFTWLERATFDLFLVDLFMPGMNGLEFCRRLRRLSDAPLVMVSGRSSREDRIAALELGADDFVEKPVHVPELVARIRAILKRSHRPTSPPELIRVGGLVIDRDRRSVLLDGQPRDLTASEFELVWRLADARGRVLSRAQLLAALPPGDTDERAVDAHVVKLRRKLAREADRPEIIRTVRHVGYVLQAGDEPLHLPRSPPR